MPAARDDLARLVSYKSVADANEYPVEECLKAAQYVSDAFSRVGFNNMRLIDMPRGHPVVFGEYQGPPGSATVLLYSHYDVQPPLDEAAWQTPVFELTERDGRWFGRGAADCKGNIVMHLTALRALGAGSYPLTIKVISEGSEEQGLRELEEFLPRNAELLKADAIVVCDGPSSAIEAAASGPTVSLLVDAMKEGNGRETGFEGPEEGPPLCDVFKETFPGTDIIVMGVGDEDSLIHATNESVDPREIESMATVEAIFLEKYAQARR